MRSHRARGMVEAKVRLAGIGVLGQADEPGRGQEGAHRHGRRAGQGVMLLAFREAGRIALEPAAAHAHHMVDQHLRWAGGMADPCRIGVAQCRELADQPRVDLVDGQRRHHEDVAVLDDVAAHGEAALSEAERLARLGHVRPEVAKADEADAPVPTPPFLLRRRQLDLLVGGEVDGTKAAGLSGRHDTAQHGHDRRC